MLERDTYLLQNQLNPFPISGQLVLTDEGHLSFTLDEKAAQASLGWLETVLGEDGLKARIESGERPVAFDLPVSGRKITWPKSLGNYGFKLHDDGRDWVVTLNYPSGGGVWQLINIFKSGGTSKPWKEALAAAGATK